MTHVADGIEVDWNVPEIAQGSIIDLLKIIAASMLGVADDVSQNALSIFVGAFIFAIVALGTTTNDYFVKAGRFTLFILTVLAIAIVVLVFVPDLTALRLRHADYRDVPGAAGCSKRALSGLQ